MSRSVRRLLCSLSPLALACALGACATSAPSAPALRTADAPPGMRADASVYGLFLAGETALGEGEMRDAAVYLNRASAQAPGTEFIKVRAFTAALEAGDLVKAVQLAPSLEHADESTRGLARLTLAVDELADGRAKEAYAALSQPGLSSPHSIAAALMKPWAAAANGDWTAALAPLDPNQEKAALLYGELGRAQLLERAGQLDASETTYKTLASGKPGVFALAYGGFLERRGRPAEAIALYDKLLAKNPADPSFAAARARAAAGEPAPKLVGLREGAAEALIGPAALLLAEKEGELGLCYLRLALKLDPDLDEAWLMVGDTMMAAGDANAARDAFAHVPPGSADYGMAQGRLALGLQETGDKDAALKLISDALKAAPDDPQLLFADSDLLQDDGRYEESVQVLDKLIARLGDSPAGWRLYYLRGVAHERAGQWPLAQADLEHALKLKPDDPDVLNYLGFSWADKGENLKQALAMLEKAAALAPDSGAIVDSLGWARYRLGEYPEAVRDLERAAALDAADPEVNDHLGDAYWRTGRRLEAQYQWRRVLTLAPDAQIKARVEAKLRSGLPETSVAQAGPREP